MKDYLQNAPFLKCVSSNQLNKHGLTCTSICLLSMNKDLALITMVIGRITVCSFANVITIDTCLVPVKHDLRR